MTISPADRAYLAAGDVRRARIDALRSARAVLGQASAGELLAAARYIETGTVDTVRRSACRRARTALAAAWAWLRGLLLACWPPARGKATVRKVGPGEWLATRPATGFRLRDRELYATQGEALASIAGTPRERRLPSAYQRVQLPTVGVDPGPYGNLGGLRIEGNIQDEDGVRRLTNCRVDRLTRAGARP